MEEGIVNKVAASSLLNVDLEDYYVKGPRMEIDLKDVLFMGQILREKDLREWVANNTWENYKNAYVAVFCSVDAIIPIWAYMLIASHLEPHANAFVFGNLVDLETMLYRQVIQDLDISPFDDQRVIIKGCGNLPVPPAAYVMLTAKLRPVAKSIMYGEACSTVPIYKKSKA